MSQMSRVVDKETEALLEGIDGPPPAPTPIHTHKVAFLPKGTTVPAGGRAVGRVKPPGGRFNRPTVEDLEHYASTEEERTAFVENDPVVRGAKGRDPLILLSILKTEVAKEAAALAYQRQLNEQMGKDISQVSSRRIDAIKKIADIEMEMRKIGFDQIDVYSEKFQKVFKFWIETIQSVAENTLTREQLDLFFNRLTTEMEGWEEKAADLVR
jgi:hypothetical protein